MRRSAYFFGLIFLIVIFISQFAYSDNKPFQVSFQLGPVAAGGWLVQGSQQIEFDASTGFKSANALGFGTGIDLVVAGEYSKSNWGILIDTGVRLHNRRKFKINTSMGKQNFENKLTMVPVTLSYIHKIKTVESRLSSFMGFGTGAYFSWWETKDYLYSDLFMRDWYKGSDISFGAHFLAGLDFKIYRDFLFKSQYRYTYIQSKWEIEDQDSDDRIDIYDLNIGGTSLRFGVGYDF